MRFDDEYRNEMNSKTLSDDFIRSLAGRMEAEACRTEELKNRNINKKETEKEITVTEHKERKNMISIKITAAAACAAAVLLASASVIRNLPEKNPPLSPVVTQFTTDPAGTEVPVTGTSEDVSAVTSESTSDAPEQTEIHEITSVVPVTEAEQTEPQQTSESEPESEAYPDTDYTENAYEIFDAFNTADSMRVGYGIKTDADQSFSYHQGANEPDYTYVLVTDERFRSLDDISDFLDNYFTKEFSDKRFDLMRTHRFREQDGELYVTQTQTSFGYQWSSDSIEISDKTETSFTMSRRYYDFGAESELVLHMIKSDTHPGWKIESAEFRQLY